MCVREYEISSTSARSKTSTKERAGKLPCQVWRLHAQGQSSGTVWKEKPRERTVCMEAMLLVLIPWDLWW